MTHPSPQVNPPPALAPPPVPAIVGDDPSALSTAQVHREILHLRELLEYRLNGLDQSIQQRADEQHSALKVAQEVGRREAEEVQASIARRVESLIHLIDERVMGLDKLTDAKFVTFRTLIESQGEKVALALAAAEKAVSKAEASTERRFDQFQEFRGQWVESVKDYVHKAEFDATTSALVDKIDDLRSSRDQGQGKSAGGQNLWGLILGGVGLVATMLFVILAFTD